MNNPFTAVSREEYEQMALCCLFLAALIVRERVDSQSETASLRGALEAEIRNAERLTDLGARAVESCEILEQALIERQIGKQADPSKVLVANLPPEKKKRKHGYTPLRQRRREAARKEEADQVRRNALPKLTAELPPIPLTPADREAMRIKEA